MGLNYKSFGDGEPIIILHGLFGMLDNWQTVGKQLAEDFQVILVDQRNHGKSFHSDEFSYELMAQDLKELMSDIGLSAAHIIGHSMGGKTAMTFAAKFADSVKSLIIVDIAPKIYAGGHEALFQAILAVNIDQIASRKEVDKQLSLSIIDQGVRLFLMKNLSRNPEGGYRWKANFKVLHDTYDNIMGIREFGQYHLPSLFIKGSKSDYILKEDRDLILSIFPLAQFIEVEGSGHWVHAEKPRELLSIIRQFFQNDGLVQLQGPD